MKLYGYFLSGNCYKIKLLAAVLEIELDWIHIDILAGETRTPEFLKRTPTAKIPVLECDDGRYLSESNAILNFLATDTEFLSKDVFEYAKIQQWQFLSSTVTNRTSQ